MCVIQIWALHAVREESSPPFALHPTTLWRHMNDHISHGVSCDCSSSRKERVATTLSCDHDHSVTGMCTSWSDPLNTTDRKLVVEAYSDNCDDEPNLVAPLVPILILSIVQPMGYTIILSYISMSALSSTNAQNLNSPRSSRFWTWRRHWAGEGWPLFWFSVVHVLYHGRYNEYAHDTFTDLSF